MKKIAAIFFAFGMISVTASAQSYQAQGCGLGSTIWTDGSNLAHQVLGATTNGTSGNQTFGMTFGTSNCQLESSGRTENQELFIEANKIALANDIARGEGETLASLTHLYGCSSTDSVGNALQSQYEAIFSSQDVTAQQINGQIQSVLAAQKACI